MSRVSVLDDGGLVLSYGPGTAAVADRWLPAGDRPESAPAPGASVIRLSRRPSRAPVPASGDGEIRVLGLHGWRESADLIRLGTRDGSVWGSVRVGHGTGRVAAAGVESDREVQRTTFAALTVSAGLLLNRRRRVLLHAGAFVAPDGGAWLLVGDSQSGKSTTCATLIRGGWSFLADDQVVAGVDPAGRVRVEGWPRAFNLDEGFGGGRSTGRRSPVDPSSLGPGRLLRSAPLAGLLFPRVDPQGPTRTSPASAGDALQALIRQSPWLLADPEAAPAVLGLMTRLARLPAFRVRLGQDSHGRPEVLMRALDPALAAPRSACTPKVTRPILETSAHSSAAPGDPPLTRIPLAIRA